jgi:hypothetical protein
MVTGEKLEDWIEEVRKCKENLLENEKWKEGDICIILTDPQKCGIQYVKFYLKLKTR